MDFSDWFAVSGASWDRVFGVKVYGDHHDKRWFRWTLWPLYRALHKIYRAKLWVYYRVHPEHRYHLVDTKLKPGYYDVDALMLHASFSLLERYVIAEMGGPEKIAAFNHSLRTEIDPHAPEGIQQSQADRQDEALALYRWWTIERPADQARYDALLHRLYGRKDFMSFEDVDGSPLKRVVLREFDEDETALNKQFRALEQKIEDDEQRMLHRLIDIRRSLWT